MKKSNRINILPGNYLVLYTNTFTDILFYITSLGTKFVNFVPFALLFKHSFIFLDAKALKIFLITVNKVNNLTLFFNLFTIYRSEEHTSELQSLMRISYVVFCL